MGVGNWVSGCNVLITGGSSGIGKETARLLLGTASRITIVSRNSDGRLDGATAELQDAAKRLCSAGGVQTLVESFAADVCDLASLDELVDRFRRSESRIDAFVNCAGGCHKLAPFDLLSAADVQTLMQVNAVAPVQWLRALMPMMRLRGPGNDTRKSAHVLLVSSRSGERPVPGLAVYAVAKASLAMLAQAMRVEYAHTGLTLTVVSPGSANTPFTSAWSSEDIADHNRVSMSASDVAREIIHCLESEHAIGTLSFESCAQWAEERIVWSSDESAAFRRHYAEQKHT
jgi:NAD(P)-dependent dehydrogenase (short-subunit alcohol dehydrogenase family)